MTDWSKGTVDTLALYYGFNNIQFKEYLRTLGLRTFPGNGKNKPAYRMLTYEASLRKACTITGTQEASIEKQIEVYPNPANSEVNISFPYPFSGKMELYDLLGRKIYSQKITNSNTESITISALPKGMYLLKLEDIITGKTSMKKIVKE